MTKRINKHYPEEFKQEAIALVGSSEKSIPEQQKSYDMQKIETTCPLQLHITNSGSEVLTITSELKEAKVFQPLS